jgi:hypothetical protein
MAKFTVPTKVLSTRIPLPVYDEIQKMVESKQISLSEWVQQSVGKHVDLKKYSKGGLVDDVDKEFMDVVFPILTGAGIGTGIYFLVKEYIKDHYPDKDAEQIAFISAMAIGLSSLLFANLGGEKGK